MSVRVSCPFCATAFALPAVITAGVIWHVVLAKRERTWSDGARNVLAAAAVFAILVVTIALDSIRTWAGVLRGTVARTTTESPFVATRLNAEEL